MNLTNDERIVLTLDAGGTNFVFSAIQGGKEMVESLTLPASGATLEDVLKNIISGFEQVSTLLSKKAAAISFCFPGPAEYEDGIIGDLANLPTFRGGVALGPMLENIFQIPVFIRNDGDLFTYGEAIAGLLPEINHLLKKRHSPKRYGNLFGATFGTGFGGGVVSRGALLPGDNSASGEINRLRNKRYPLYSVEESVSIRGIKNVFMRESGISAASCPEPREIFQIAMQKEAKNRQAAITAFQELAEVAGSALADSISLIDGLVVIGGGLSGAHPVFLQKLVDEMNHAYDTPGGNKLDRMEIRAYNLENPEELNLFLQGDAREIKVPFFDQKITYDPVKRIGVGISRLGTVKAVSAGAYAYAIHQLDQQK
ncbi:MAG: ROK family protein [Bacteroidales bacterium]|nr:ROK family protein [Bacteroidales bacterium]MDD3011103.1 ROK family protein [Bacteroidales bacterium]MDD3960357.1 ROK family protein [Bacteroidales bacterium]MDY0284955.1 ROK family protein [Bacteroidales bacterium]